MDIRDVLDTGNGITKGPGNDRSIENCKQADDNGYDRRNPEPARGSDRGFTYRRYFRYRLGHTVLEHIDRDGKAVVKMGFFQRPLVGRIPGIGSAPNHQAGFLAQGDRVYHVMQLSQFFQALGAVGDVGYEFRLIT